MSGEPQLVIVGNATSDAELRITPSGATLAAFTVAQTPRIKQANGEWADGETNFYRCTVWRDAAESAAESITKGMRLIVVGRFKPRQYEKDGQTRTSLEIDVDEVGPSLRYATAKVNKMQRSSGNGQSNSGGGFADDPWASATPAASPARPGGGFDSSESAPF